MCFIYYRKSFREKQSALIYESQIGTLDIPSSKCSVINLERFADNLADHLYFVQFFNKLTF